MSINRKHKGGKKGVSRAELAATTLPLTLQHKDHHLQAHGREPCLTELVDNPA
jgi:hypothetical protein